MKNLPTGCANKSAIKIKINEIINTFLFNLFLKLIFNKKYKEVMPKL